MNNVEIRQRAKLASVKLWEVAEHLGMSENTFSRLLRHELSKDAKERALRAIEEISAARQQKEVRNDE